MSGPSHHTVESVVQLGSSLLSLPPRPPLSTVTTARLLSLCVGLRQVGCLLEAAAAPTLRALLQLLAELCQSPELELVVRLRLLEVVELGSLGWRSLPLVESNYRQRFAMLGAGTDLCTVVEGGGEEAMEAKGEVALVARGEETLVVRGATVTLRSAEPAALAAAASALGEFFARPQVGTVLTAMFTMSITSNMSTTMPTAQVIRSRSEILALASSPLSTAPPPDWAALAPALPSVMIRGRVGDQEGQGDLGGLEDLGDMGDMGGRGAQGDQAATALVPATASPFRQA